MSYTKLFIQSFKRKISFSINIHKTSPTFLDPKPGFSESKLKFHEITYFINVSSWNQSYYPEEFILRSALVPPPPFTDPVDYPLWSVNNLNGNNFPSIPGLRRTERFRQHSDLEWWCQTQGLFSTRQQVCWIKVTSPPSLLSGYSYCHKKSSLVL